MGRRAREASGPEWGVLVQALLPREDGAVLALGVMTGESRRVQGFRFDAVLSPLTQLACEVRSGVFWPWLHWGPRGLPAQR